MTDRGEYRAIRRVLLDGPDFQQLSDRARWVFVALKLNIGPTGIEVHYRSALACQLSEQTGLSPEQVGEAMDELEAAGWIHRELNVLWIDGQLQHDPHMQPSNEKHRKAIHRHITALPRLSIVRAFVEAHQDWFTDDESAFLDSLPNGYRMAIESPSTEDRRPNTDQKNVAKATGGEPPEIEPDEKRVCSMIPPAIREHAWLGNDPPHKPKGWHMGREIDVARELLKQYSPEEIVGGIETYREQHGLEADLQWSLSWVIGKGDRWRIETAIRTWRNKQIDATDVPTFTPKLKMIHVA